MKHNGKDVLFLVHKEYLNYRYHEPAFGVAAKLVSSKIQDSYLAENGETVLWIEKKYNDRLPARFAMTVCLAAWWKIQSSILKSVTNSGCLIAH